MNLRKTLIHPQKIVLIYLGHHEFLNKIYSYFSSFINSKSSCYNMLFYLFLLPLFKTIIAVIIITIINFVMDFIKTTNIVATYFNINSFNWLINIYFL